MRSTNRLFIHIGTHKTGSTAIQNALRAAAPSLRKEGIVYLARPTMAMDLMRSSQLDDRAIRDGTAELRRLLAREHGKRGSVLVWSFEGFSGESRLGYENSPVVAESLKIITAGLDVRIIVYLRRQDQFIESLYTQRIHEGESYSFESYLERLPALPFNWYRLLQGYAECFGKERIIVRRYDKAFLRERASLVSDFAGIIGSGCLASYAGSRVPNRGYSRDALEVARLVNPHLDDAARGRLRRTLQETSSKQPFETYSFYSDEQRSHIRARYAPSNSRVAREFFDEASGTLFPAVPPDESPPPYRGLTLEAAVVILTRAIVTESERNNGSARPSMLRKIRGKIRASLREASRWRSRLMPPG